MQHGAASAVGASGRSTEIQQQHDSPERVATLSLTSRCQMHRRVRVDILYIESKTGYPLYPEFMTAINLYRRSLRSY